MKLNESDIVWEKVDDFSENIVNADYVINLINLLDTRDIEKVARALIKKLDQKIINLKPSGNHDDYHNFESLVKNFSNLKKKKIDESIFSLFENDGFKNILSTGVNFLPKLLSDKKLLYKGIISLLENMDSDSLQKILPKKISKPLPKLIGLYKEVFESNGHEETLINSLIPFLSKSQQAKIIEYSWMIKMIKVFRLIRENSIFE